MGVTRGRRGDPVHVGPVHDDPIREGEGHEGAGGRLVLALLALLAVLAGGAYVAAYAAAGNDVPRGVTVAGVEIGGLTPAHAEEVLRERLGQRVQETVRVTGEDGGSAGIDPMVAGLSVDWEATVRAAGGGRSWHPADLWEHYTLGGRLDPVPQVDEAALETTLERLDGVLGEDAADGAVRFTREAEVRVTEPVPGRAVDHAAARATIVEAWLSGNGAPVELPMVDTSPAIDEDDVQDALDQVANPAVSGAVTLVFDDTPVRLEPQRYVAALSLEPEGGALVPRVHRRRLERLLGDVVGDEDAPVDASFEVVRGKPRVVPGKPGADYDPEVVARNFLRLVEAAPERRRLEVEATVVAPELTAREARALGISEQVSAFTTTYPHAGHRTTSIRRAATLVDGTVLEPGDTFSMNGLVGDMGGGASLLATTLFNATFFAGLEEVERTPHSSYLPRYPVGRDATVALGAADLAFRNDTGHGVLVRVTVRPSTPGTDGVVTVRMYSTKAWDIGSITSERHHETEPTTRRVAGQACEPRAGHGGFDVDVTRVFRRPGENEVQRREAFHTTYAPSDAVICQ